MSGESQDRLASAGAKRRHAVVPFPASPRPRPAGCFTAPWSCATVFVLLALVLRPLAATAPIVLDIPVFAGGYGIAAYEEAARAFEQARPDVRVNLYGDPRIADKIRVRVIDGQLPDAMLPRDVLIPALARTGKLLPLEDLLDAPNWERDARWGDTFRPGALESWTVDGRRYGVPITYACWSLFYNRGLFHQHGWREPRTWDEFFAWCEQVRRDAPEVAPVALTGIYGSYPEAFLRAAYYNLTGEAGWRALQELQPGAYADPAYVRAAEVLQRITTQHTLAGWEGMTHTSAQLAFLEGRAALTVSGSWMLAEMAGRIPPELDIGVMNFPVFADGVADPSAIQTSADCFFVFATGRPAHERATVDFLRFLTSRGRAAALVRQLDAPVAVKGIPLAAFSPAMRETARLIDEAQAAFNMPQRMLQTPTVRQALIDQRQALMAGRISPGDYAAQIEAAAATDRARLADPTRVEIRHPWAGGALLTAVTLAAVALLDPVGRWRRRQRKGGRGRAATSESETLRQHFGPLRGRFAVSFVGPALLLYAAFVLLPGLTAFGWAFLRWDGLGEKAWAGAYQFKRLLFEFEGFWPALQNNLFLMVVPALVVVPVALFFATLFHRGVWGGTVFRVVFLFPNLLGGIAATLLWLNAYEPFGGLVNASLVALGELTGSQWLQSFSGYPWLAPANLYPALVPVYLWMACGFNLILYLAAMEGIDAQLYEAAELDGAGPWRQFFVITLPMIREVLVVSAVFIVIAGLNAFEMVWLLTSQDPDTATHTLGTLMVSSMFKEFDVGRATAIAVILFVLVFLCSAWVLRARRTEGLE